MTPYGILLMTGSLLILGCSSERSESNDAAIPTRPTFVTSCPSGLIDDEIAASASDTHTISPDPMERYPELTRSETWIVDRFGPESGVVVYDVRSDRRVWEERLFFREHGNRLAKQIYENGELASRFVETVDSLYWIDSDSGGVTVHPWWSEIGIEYPNFRHLTLGMCDYFNIVRHSTRELLGRTVEVFTIAEGGWDLWHAEVWIWEGIVLYEKRIHHLIEGDTTIRRAISIDESQQPSELFSLRE